MRHLPAKLMAAIICAPCVSPDDMAKLIAEETVKWKKVIDFAGLKADQ